MFRDQASRILTSIAKYDYSRVAITGVGRMSLQRNLNAERERPALGRSATVDARRRIAGKPSSCKRANHGSHYCRYRPAAVE